MKKLNGFLQFVKMNEDALQTISLFTLGMVSSFGLLGLIIKAFLK